MIWQGGMIAGNMYSGIIPVKEWINPVLK